MVAELTFTGARKKKTFEYTNNGKISFTEYEWKKQRLGASATYLKARNKLIEVGFIKITYRGGMARGDMNKYELLFIEGVKVDDKRWKRYPKENWEHEIPKVEDFAVGKETRFK
jgi:methionine synthase II (cobalamin-independent)